MRRIAAFQPGSRMMKAGAALIAMQAVMSGGVGGCQKALFPKDMPRTQYETYDRMRNHYVPLEEPDVFGNPQPALRARLSQSR